MGVIKSSANALRSATTRVDVSAATAPSNGQVLTATGSTAATWQTPSGGGTAAFTTDYDATIGDIVGINFNGNIGISNYNDGGIGQVSTPDTVTNAYQYICSIGSRKFAVAYLSATNTAKAAILTYDPATQTWSYGSSVTLSTDVGSYQEMYIATLDDDKFVVGYIGHADNTKVYTIACTVSGTTITPGSIENPYTHAGGALYAAGFRGVQMGTDKVAWYFARNSATAYSGLMAGTYSGTTGSYGTPAALDTTYFNQGARIELLDTDKIVCMSFGTLAVQIVTFSGTTGTPGTAQTFTLTGSNNETSTWMQVISSSSFAIANASQIIAATVSGTTPTFGSAIAHGASAGYIKPIIGTTDKFYVWGSSIVKEIGISGSTLTDNGVWYGDSGINTGSSTFTYLVNISATEWYLFACTSTYTRGMSSEHAPFFFGIAQGTVSGGGSLTVKYSGVDSNQSGLGPGAWYHTDDDGTLAYIGLTLPTTSNEHFVLRALSATQLLLP